MRQRISFFFFECLIKVMVCNSVRCSFIYAVDPDTWAPTILTSPLRAAPQRASISKGYRIDLESYRLPRYEMYNAALLSFFNFSGLKKGLYFSGILFREQTVSKLVENTSLGFEGLTLNLAHTMLPHTMEIECCYFAIVPFDNDSL